MGDEDDEDEDEDSFVWRAMMLLKDCAKAWGSRRCLAIAKPLLGRCLAIA